MMSDKKQSVFDTLNQIDVGKWIEKKGNLSYLSWANAYAEVKRHYPLMQYKTHENDLGFNYHTDGHSCWVKVSTTIEDLEHIEYLPVMDFKNKSIPKDKVTSMDVNTAIQRALTKSLARHGLGLYIYAGEDLPQVINDAQVNRVNELIQSTSTDKKTFLEYYRVKEISELSQSYALDAIFRLEKKIT